MTVVEQFGEDIWIVNGDIMRLYGIPFPTRASIVRLSHGGLWVHSPVARTPSLRAEVAAIGPVEHLVAPNKFHSAGIVPWQKQWPDAKTWISPKFHGRHPEVPYDGILSNDVPGVWVSEIDQHVFAGHSILDEVLFLHRPSKTLIVTDLIQKHDPSRETWFWRQLKRLVGVVGKMGGVPKDIQMTFRDKRAARMSRDHILSWDFDRLIVSHGFCLRTGAKAEVERVLSCL